MVRQDDDQIIRGAYRISEEVGQEVETLIRGGRQVSREQLDDLYQKLQQHLDAEPAKHIYNALVNALIPSPEREEESGS